ncbi:MAG: CcmD family protein [Candidatus Poribacteria bacterium]|nr:CcmD family protein [Candidatus Poribacteria bacterium]
MRAVWAVMGVLFVLSAVVAITATIPVGINAQEVGEEAEVIAESNPNMPSADVIDAAVSLLRLEQRRRVTYLALAYLFVWTVLGGYMALIARRQGRLQAELARLQARVDRSPS